MSGVIARRALWCALLVAIAPCNGALRFGDGTCASDSECPLSTLHCDVSARRCVACVDDNQCSPPLPRCDAALRRCIACGNDVDCATGLVCQRTTHRCVQPCGVGVPIACPATAPRCDDDHRFCTTCESESSATACASSSAGHHCLTPVGLCVACLADGDCSGSATPHCDVVTNRCVQCQTSDDCGGATPWCDPATWTCVAAP